MLRRQPDIRYDYVERIDPVELAGVGAVGGLGVLGGIFCGLAVVPPAELMRKATPTRAIQVRGWKT